MSLEDLTPSNRFELALSGDMTAEEASNRIEKILAGADIEPADRLEYFLKLRVSGGGGGGDEPPVLYQVGTSTLYAENTVISADVSYQVIKKLAGAQKLKTVKCLRTDAYGGGYDLTSAFKGCPLLESVHFLNGLASTGYSEDIIKDCPNIREFITGDIGHPNTVGMGSTSSSYYLFRNVTAAFDIIIYTNAATLADVPAVLKDNAPWGATNATIIYKSSVSGEVLS